jgi:predicted nucleotidyltransferase
MKTLFETIVGSHAWNMQRPDSDIDIFQAYQVPTKDILSGILRQNSHFTAGEDKDESRHEIGVVIEQLLKGNFNFVVGVCSPIVNEDKYGYLKDLREIVVSNLSKNIYHSIRGLAIHNYKKYFNPTNDIIRQEILQKKANLIVRSLLLGEAILTFEEVCFHKIKDQTEEDIQYWMKALDEAYEDSKLPELPDPTKFRDYLYKLRIQELEEKRTEI